MKAKDIDKYQRSYLVKSVLVIVTFGIFMMASLYFNQKNKQIQIENEKKEALLKMTPLPGHKGVETGGDPKDPQAKTRRDFVKKVFFYSLCFFIDAHSHFELKLQLWKKSVFLFFLY